MKLAVAAVFVALAAIGCKKADDGKVVSCVLGPESCIEYRGDDLAPGEDALRGACVGAKSAFAAVACPTAKLVATCERLGGKTFFYQPFVLADVEASCHRSSGTFAKP